MSELISEPISPHAGTFTVGAMGRGEPGLPRGFDWRGQSYLVAEVLRVWKHSSREGARTGGQLYLRRHYFELRMNHDQVWTVYFVRQTPRSGDPKRRWFLYSLRPWEAPLKETDHAP